MEEAVLPGGRIEVEEGFGGEKGDAAEERAGVTSTGFPARLRAENAIPTLVLVEHIDLRYLGLLLLFLLAFSHNPRGYALVTITRPIYCCPILLLSLPCPLNYHPICPLVWQLFPFTLRARFPPPVLPFRYRLPENLAFSVAGPAGWLRIIIFGWGRGGFGSGGGAGVCGGVVDQDDPRRTTAGRSRAAGA
jgi:hypothetical protein